MIIVDAHCDTASEILDRKTSLYRNECHADIWRMHEKGSWVQFFAAFSDPAVYKTRELYRTLQIIDSIYAHAERYKDHMSVCTSSGDVLKALDDNKVASILSIEGGEALQGSLSNLRMLYRLGVRSICLTWNYRNELADGVKDGSSGGGLTPFGFEAVAEMQRLGMLVDVSHLSDKGFWDVIGMAKSPIIASHSNARAVCRHPRNLSDEQISALKQNGGVMGINFYPAFLKDSDDPLKPAAASTDDMVRHIEHVVSLAGEECVGLGADFDGIDITPEDIKGIQDIDKLFNRLLALNYSEGFIEKLAGGNFLRVMKEVLVQ